VSQSARTAFADRLVALVEERRSQVCLGLDPDPAKLWPGSIHPEREPADQGEIALLTAAAVTQHCVRAIDAAGPACVAVKPQLACFERLGAVGWGALEAVVAAGQDAGLLVLADAKRGDVPVTAQAYAQALVGETPGPYGPVKGLGVDALTANPMLGRDALEPLTSSGAGVFVLVRTSNPGAAEIQDVPDDLPLHDRVARMVDEIGADHIGQSGLSSIGAVTGATRPDLLRRLRDLMPKTIFLLPGVGAQGGTVDDLQPAFEPHPAAGLITASRSIVNAYEKTGGDPAKAAAQAAEQLRRSAWR
jgi:orotidine-5'-phosphate decarboxylase